MKKTSSSRPKWRVLTSYVVPWSSSEQLLDEPRVGRAKVIPYLSVTLMVAILTLMFWKIGYAFTLVNLALLYLLPVLVSAVRWGLGSAFYAAGIGVVAFDFFFVPPIHTFTVSDIRYFVSFAVYLAVAAFTASLAAELRKRVRDSRERESVTSALFALSNQVAAARDLDTVLGEIVGHASRTFGLATVIMLPDASGQLTARAQMGLTTVNGFTVVEPRVVSWVFEHGKMAGYGTNTHRNTSILYVPLKTESTVHGVMCIGTQRPLGKDNPHWHIRVVQALAGLAAVSIARVRYEEKAQIAHLTAESERLRTSLLDSISHELRTPLATIIGAVTGLIDGENFLSNADRQELLVTVREGAMRMNRLITNLLGMVRLESGMLQLNKKWCDVADIVGVALRQVKESLQNRKVEVNLQSSLPPAAVDEVLIEQVLVNLMSNAAKYSADGTTIELDVMEYDGVLTIRIRDYGIGIEADDAEKIFEKFYRTDTGKNVPGTGLGLAICKGIIQAHGGEIFARPGEKAGTVITIRLPVGDAPEPILETAEEFSHELID
ncbi:ATP-binding protein [Alicyclobacillus ferrooxydans]|nr:ATP-binding protein [Alicyclobacillus ferrooxydans]